MSAKSSVLSLAAGPFPSQRFEPPQRQKVLFSALVLFPLHIPLFHHIHLLLGMFLFSSAGVDFSTTRTLQTSTLHRSSHILFAGSEIESCGRKSAMAEHPLHFWELGSGFEHPPSQTMPELVR